MILPFSTQLNGKPTYFVERIHKGIREGLKTAITFKTKNFSYQFYMDCEPKLHTIREDLKDRWKPGTKIDFFINCRQKDMFRFAPVIPLVSTQKIEFIWKDNTKNLTCLGMSYDKTCTIMIDNRFFGDVLLHKGSIVSASDNLPAFAQNDGFDTLQDLLGYFNKNFTGKIIHWTNFKY